MAESIHLIGAEEVARAASTFAGAAESMRNTFSYLDESLTRNAGEFGDLLTRLERLQDRAEQLHTMRTAASEIPPGYYLDRHGFLCAYEPVEPGDTGPGDWVEGETGEAMEPLECGPASISAAVVEDAHRGAFRSDDAQAAARDAAGLFEDVAKSFEGPARDYFKGPGDPTPALISQAVNTLADNVAMSLREDLTAFRDSVEAAVRTPECDRAEAEEAVKAVRLRIPTPGQLAAFRLKFGSCPVSISLEHPEAFPRIVLPVELDEAGEPRYFRNVPEILRFQSRVLERRRRWWQFWRWFE